MERRLAAILVADMVGYSRMMAADEVGTLNRLKHHRIELIDPKIAEYGGRGRNPGAGPGTARRSARLVSVRQGRRRWQSE